MTFPFPPRHRETGEIVRTADAVSSPPTRITVFGGTSGTGRQLVRQAIDAGQAAESFIGY
jgi:hypothetical protein